MVDSFETRTNLRLSEVDCVAGDVVDVQGGPRFLHEIWDEEEEELVYSNQTPAVVLYCSHLGSAGRRLTLRTGQGLSEMTPKRTRAEWKGGGWGWGWGERAHKVIRKMTGRCNYPKVKRRIMYGGGSRAIVGLVVLPILLQLATGRNVAALMIDERVCNV